MNPLLVDLCHFYGPLLRLPADIDGKKLMWAIAGVESSEGTNDAPRYEGSYDIGGQNYRNEQIQLVAEAPKDPQGRSRAAFSYGFWQMLPCDAYRVGFNWQEISKDPEKAAQAFVAYVNNVIVVEQKAGTLSEICQCWNAGHYQPNPLPGVQRYVAQAQKYYDAAQFLEAA